MKNKDEDNAKLNEKMAKIKNKIVILSGKGGVGKSTVAVNLAVFLKAAGKSVGLLDVDIHGPSIPKLLNLEGRRLTGNENNELVPIYFSNNLKVISIGLLLNKSEDAIIWRGPRKYGIIKEFLSATDWGELDYLIVDAPPGTGDEPMAVCQLMGSDVSAIIVTTPQDLSILDVEKSITFCRELNINVLGIIENMSGFVCPKCGEKNEIFKSGGGKELAAKTNVPFLGTLPIDPEIVKAGDDGKPFISDFTHNETAKAFSKIVVPILKVETNKHISDETLITNGGNMKIAIPVVQGKLCMHFGHSEKFALIDVDMEKKEIKSNASQVPPPHEPGVIPAWLAKLGADVIIAGGMGARAQSLFQEKGIKVVVGAPGYEPETIVKNYIDGTLQTGENVCDH